uniref:Uncharacterized protein n=1 Tax=Cucumis melo TaxID=3656 RepID=A0A9I9DKS2_CUCME
MEKLSVKSEREDKTARPKSSLDLFDLGMLGMDVEEQTHTSESEKELSVHKEGERSEEMLDSKFDNVSVSSTKEVMYAREEDDSKSIQCVSNGTHSSSGDKITLVQCCLSNDEESFHSCGDSNFLNRRLSNASETSSANVITNSTCSVPTANLASKLEIQCDESNKLLTSDQSHLALFPCNSKPKMQMVPHFVGFQKNFDVPFLSPPPPPPSPPPPPPAVTDRYLFSLSLPFSTRPTSSSALLIVNPIN